MGVHTVSMLAIKRNRNNHNYIAGVVEFRVILFIDAEEEK